MKLEPLPRKPNLNRYDKLARDLAKTFRSADAETMYWIRQRHPRLPGRPNTNDRNPVTDEQVRRTGLTIADARAIVAGMHQFESWRDFAKFIRDLNEVESPAARFEAAAEAVIDGNLPRLRRLLCAHPELIRMRSTREHRATLLHYVGANAVEQYRQKTPKNIVKVAEVLLDAGAAIDADLDYGPARDLYPERIGSTTLGLAATSCHPAAAGVQIPLMDLLINRGASVEGLHGGWSIVIVALHNGRGQAAAHLAKRGGRLDLEGAAGTGRLDVVKSFFTDGGSLKRKAMRTQLELGFLWACEYGHARVVSFLLERGIDLSAMPQRETGLHWACYGGHANVVKIILRYRPALDLKDRRFNATPLEWALHAWREAASKDRSRSKVYYEIVARLVRAGVIADEQWLAQRPQTAKFVGADRKMQAALSGKLPGGGRRSR